MALTASNNDFSSKILEARDISSEVVEKFSENLNVDTITQSSDSSFSSTEVAEAFPAVLAKLREITKSDPKQDAVHFMMLMFRASNISTSTLVKYTGSYSYTVSGTSHEIKDADIFPQINHLLAKYKKPNPLRAFLSSFETPYILFSKLHPNLNESRIACRRGTPQGYGYLAADFLLGTSPILSDRERAIINKATEHAINRANTSSVSRELVNLYDL
ncbi:CPm [Tobacco virus 1]|uniref:CPm n=1 Tax=Tobacco virus 1 TaxID=1692045 RepID=A0A0K1HRH0_9CLOS|nr:CPm [Tobacco virus 1]AKT94762.1 CPm [Tobacco virus 1]